MFELTMTLTNMLFYVTLYLPELLNFKVCTMLHMTVLYIFISFLALIAETPTDSLAGTNTTEGTGLL